MRRRLHGTSEHLVYWYGSMGSTYALVAANIFSGWKSKSRYAATDRATRSGSVRDIFMRTLVAPTNSIKPCADSSISRRCFTRQRLCTIRPDLFCIEESHKSYVL